MRDLPSMVSPMSTEGNLGVLGFLTHNPLTLSVPSEHTPNLAASHQFRPPTAALRGKSAETPTLIICKMSHQLS